MRVSEIGKHEEWLYLGDDRIEVVDATSDIKTFLVEAKERKCKVRAELLEVLLSHPNLVGLLGTIDHQAIACSVKTLSEKIHECIYTTERNEHTITLYGVEFTYW